MKIMMADGKVPAESDSPTYIVTPEQSKKGVQKKYIIMGVSAVLVVGLILAAILIGMHMFSEAQKEIVKFSLQFKGSQNQDVNQDVVSDPNDNVVMFTVTSEGKIVNIVNDFNKALQIVKFATDDGKTSCYVTILNVSEAMDPSKITGKDSMTGSQGGKGPSTPYKVASDPVKDRSFMTKKAADMCSGVSVYWAQKNCMDGIALPQNSTDGGLVKRTLYNMSPYQRMGGVGGCCIAYWACYVQMTEYISGTYHQCQTYYETGWCCGANPYYNPPIAYPYCANLYSACWYTPGLACAC
jgi:hypothetical protein